MYLDINTFAFERFSSGLFKYIRAILLRFKDRGENIKFLSIAHYLQVQNTNDQTVGIADRVIKDIPVEEHLLPETPNDSPEHYRHVIKDSLDKNKPDIVFINSQAVFLEEHHILFLEEIIGSGARLVMFVVDHLFPTTKTHPPELVERYYKLVKQTEVISCSPLIISHFLKETGIEAKLFLNLISTNESISNFGQHEHVAMVNIHPIKGIIIFDAIARKMPNQKFLLIKNWPDVPTYVSPPNVTLKDLYSDVRDFYAQVKILLVPSLHDEGQPGVITEAMLNGIPVIANAIGGIPEIPATDGVFLIPAPPINGFNLVGTILYPNVKPEDIENVADQYVSTIKMIDASPNGWHGFSDGLRKQALANAQQSENSFEIFYNHWKQSTK